MKRSQMSWLLVKLLLLIFATGNFAMGQAPLGSGFTFQAKLDEAGQPANGSYNMEFRLYGDAVGGTQIGSTENITNIPVVDGRFTVELDFGSEVFDGDARWLQVEVDNVVLSPRQPITGSPYSIQTRGIFADENENLGVGTTTPSAKLHVRGNGSGTVMRVSNGGPGGTAIIAGDVTGTGSAASFYGITSSNLMTVHNDGSGRAALFRGDVSFAAGDVDVAGELIVGPDNLAVLSNGFVGIGRQTPIVPNNSYFDVQTPAGNNQFGGMHMATDGEGGIPYYGYAAGGTTDAFTFFNGGTGDWGLRTFGIDRITVKNNGRVGISTFTPGFLLEVNGSAGKPGGGSWSNSSDRRLKKNIQDLAGSLEKLMKLRGVSFEYIDPKAINELEGERIGVIAQEVEKVFPDWVHQRDDGYKAVTFRGFEALTVEALCELRSEKDEQIQTLEAENDQLRERLETLEANVQRLLTNQ